MLFSPCDRMRTCRRSGRTQLSYSVQIDYNSKQDFLGFKGEYRNVAKLISLLRVKKRRKVTPRDERNGRKKFQINWFKSSSSSSASALPGGGVVGDLLRSFKWGQTTLEKLWEDGWQSGTDTRSVKQIINTISADKD